MARAELILDFPIVFGALVLVVDNQRNGRAAGLSGKDTRKDLDPIRFLALGCKTVLAGPTAV